MITELRAEARTKAREQRVRRLLASQGYILRKSRRRGWPTLDDQGKYMVIEATSDICTAGCRYDMTLDEVERWATEDEPS